MEDNTDTDRKMEINVKIIDMDVQDIRFPTSLWHNESEVSMYHGVNYSCVYVTIKTDNEKYKGYGITCTMGNGNELVLQACKLLFELIKNKTTEEIYDNFASIWKKLTTNEYNGTEKWCVIHLAAAAIINALWDLWARIEGKPAWKFLTDMSPEKLVSTVDFKYIRHILSKKEAIEMLKGRESKREYYEKKLKQDGCCAYVSDVGQRYPWQKTRDHCRKYVKLNFTNFKITASLDLEETLKNSTTTRQMIGKKKLILDAGQAWDGTDKVAQNITRFKDFNLYCVEEPTFSDDFEEYVKISKKLRELWKPKDKSEKRKKIKFATGKMCANHIVCKELNKFPRAIRIWMMNVARLGGINEALAIYLMLHKLGKYDVWGCANGVGLGEMAQHLQMWDFVCLSQSDSKNHLIEFVDLQHGYFENPVYIRKGCYMPPQLPGFSTKLKDKCIKRWSYPEGTRWKYLFQKKRFENEYEGNNS